MLDLKVGDVIRRRKLHEYFGGQQQGGISTPANHPVILAFTGSSGGQHGYNDGWSNGVFCYFGEGQTGPMQFRGGNRALRDHAKDSKDVLLFEMAAKAHVRFAGFFAVASWEQRTAPDKNGSMREAIVFHLAAIGAEIETGQSAAPANTSLAELRERALISGSSAPRASVSAAARSAVLRSDAVVEYAEARAAGVCECCNALAPFVRPSGRPYLEVHHLKRLTDGGPDLPDAVAAICPTCHRRVHHGLDGAQLNSKLSKLIAKKETAFIQQLTLK